MDFSYFQPKTKIKIVHNHFAGFKNKLAFVVLAFFVISNILSLPVSARTFNPHNIFTDTDLTDKNSLSKAAIQKFLEREGSVLANYTQVVGDKTMTASEIIWEVGQKHNISPKFLLTTLEKEQGLVQKATATQKALDWATGYSCFANNCNEKHKGFYNQLEASAETQEIYLQKAGQFGFVTGKESITTDGYKVTPQNNATTNLYIYTPYVGHAPELGINSQFGANKLFWRIWHKYFSSQKFLDGQIITFNGSYYLIANNTKRQFANRELFLKDYTESDAINVSSKDLNNYPNGPIINFANNTLVKSSASGQIFLLTGNMKRPLLSNAALALLSDFHLAVTEAEIPSVSENQIAEYSQGPFIDITSTYPQGKLFRDTAGQIWLVQDGLKHTVDSVVWQSKFKSKDVQSIASVDQYPTGEPVKLKDGTFVIAGGKFYLISQGARMRIDDPGIFDRIFGANKRTTALNISTQLLEIHSAGENIDYIDDSLQDPPAGTTYTPVAGSYGGAYETMSPDGLILINGQSQSVTVSFKNTGGTTWQQGSVYLKVTDKGSDSSSFGVPAKIELNEASVASLGTGNFAFNLTAPLDKSGLLNQEFNLMYDSAGVPTKMASVGKFIIVKSGLAAQILEHNIPIAIKNDWKPIEISIKINNASPDTTWLSQRTALKLLNHDGKTSPFYDSNDWVRTDVVGVPLNKKTIAPGENGEFKFTLDPRGVKPGIYSLNFELHLLDKGKQPYLNGGLQWKREIRIDD